MCVSYFLAFIFTSLYIQFITFQIYLNLSAFDCIFLNVWWQDMLTSVLKDKLHYSLICKRTMKKNFKIQNVKVNI